MDSVALHTIKAYLYDNALTKDDVNDYVARVSSEHSLSVQQIADSAALRGTAVFDKILEVK
jgi:hypothetical protein